MENKKVSFFNKYIYRGDKRFFLSTLALVLGIVMFAGGATQGQEGMKIGGIYMILGALAYKSAKKVRIGIVKHSTNRFVLELVAMAVIALFIWFTEKDLAVNDPFPYLVIPTWAIIAYIIVRFKSKDVAKTTAVIMLLLAPYVSNAAFDSNLYYGLQNNNSVKEMQDFLTEQKVYDGPITGNFYSLTLKAVKDFQKKENISPVSGFFGPLTRTKANEILSANVEPSNQQAIQETGSTPPPAEPAKTTNDVVKSLQDQIALLLQQVQAMQTQQTSVQQLQQTVQQQAETINQIQQNTQQTAQNTQQIAQNTTPPVKGCTSRTAENYNPSAVEDDGSCNYPDKTAPKVTNHRFSSGENAVSWLDSNFPGYGSTHKNCYNCILIITDEPTTVSITYFNYDDLIANLTPERKVLWDVPETNSKNQAIDGQLQAEPQRLLSFEDGLKTEHVISFDLLNLSAGVNYIYKFEVKDAAGNIYKQQFNGSYGLPISWSLSQKIKKQ